jgi:hypothetical protein
MTEADIDSILARLEPQADGRYRAIASRFLEGRPVGPFDYRGKRRDDPNDRVRHEDRRELRGLRVFAAWVSHFDTKQHNTLDMYVEENDRRFVRHYLIDLASTLGSGVFGPTARETHAYIITPTFFGRTLTLGLSESDWRKIQRPEGLNEVGYFSAEYFDPMKYRPNFRNAAFVNMTDRDGYWAAKITTAFTDEHLRAIVAEGHYSNPDAVEHVLQVLAERRDIIGKAFFDRIPPLDFFSFQDGIVRFRDLGTERNIYASGSTVYRVRLGACDAQRNVRSWSNWEQPSTLAVDVSGVATASGAPFIALDLQADRGSGWSRSVFAYVAARSGRVVAVDR